MIEDALFFFLVSNHHIGTFQAMRLLLFYLLLLFLFLLCTLLLHISQLAVDLDSYISRGRSICSRTRDISGAPQLHDLSVETNYSHVSNSVEFLTHIGSP